MNIVTIHRVLFIIFAFVVFVFNQLNIALTHSSNPYGLPVLLALIAIGTIGISHGALDGKIIWESSNDIFRKLRIYSLYLLLSFLGALLWYLYPLVGLSILLFISVIHFGNSDLYDPKGMKDITKKTWGFSVTFMPTLFYKSDVADIFMKLTGYMFSETLMTLIQFITALTIAIFFLNVMNEKITNSKIIILEMVSLVVIAAYLHPIEWFAIYFCGLHGIRALINGGFKVFPDILWLMAFTLPVIFAVYMILGETGAFIITDLLVVFPILASLTIAHMLLRKIIKIING
ncbi:MAG: beta-carotene 15,15'-dioxygenase, Brp/Blh family [Nitrosomonadales bacterium]|jgi:Brp/Blh family beta-carotene 15,15'-monooxygenase|nr:beta-carotene 15,15'-dioxygenase, Brp/Blh family [Nitrosomonadales bacterium]|tara:strand:+ start:6709 stop:7575 length:867 start_codon:yes stop_codon:yes gene_type:complete